MPATIAFFTPRTLRVYRAQTLRRDTCHQKQPMSCHTCERRSRANFYNRYVSQLGYGSITMLMSAAYFAGIRLSDRNTRAEWREDALYVSSTPNRVSVCVRAGAQN